MVQNHRHAIRRVLIALTILSCISVARPLQAKSDPSLPNQQAILSSPDSRPSTSFSSQIAYDGTTAVIGAAGRENNRGGAYVYVQNGGNWVQQAVLTAFDGQIDDYMGGQHPNHRRIAVSGDTIAIGVPFRPDGTGAVYIFVRSGISWSLQQKISSSSAGFGHAVALEGDTLLFSDLSVNDMSGVAYIYARTAGNWIVQATLNPDTITADTYFGDSVAINGNTAIIGNSGHNGSHGAGYVFIRSGTVWTKEALLDPADNDSYGAGNMTAIQDDLVILGAPWGDNGMGSAFVFRRSGTTWIKENKLFGFATSTAFGTQIGFSGTSLIIGAPNPDYGGWKLYHYVKDGGFPNWLLTQVITAPPDAKIGFVGNTFFTGNRNANWGRGEVQVFNYSGGAWTQTTTFTLTDATRNTSYSRWVAMDGNTAVVASHGENDGRGAVYIYTRLGQSWVQQQKITLPGLPIDAEFGTGVAIDGDTLAIGRNSANDYAGAIYVYRWDGIAWTQESEISLSNGTACCLPGNVLAISGNTIAAGGFATDQDHGAVAVFTRIGTTWTQQAFLTANDAAVGDLLATDLGTLSIDGDTIAASARNATVDGNTRNGAVYIFHRNGETWAQQSKIAPALGNNSEFGFAVAVSGNRVVVGSPNEAGVTKGAAYVYARIGSVWFQQARLTASDLSQTAEGFGSAVALDGNRTVIGRRNPAAVYAFTFDGNWQQQQKFVSDTGYAWEYLAIAMSGGLVIAGDQGWRNETGRAYIFDTIQDGSRMDTIGIYRPSNHTFYLKNSNQTGVADFSVAYGTGNVYPITGDWNGDGIDTIGVYDQDSGVFLLRNSNTPGVPEIVFTLGNPGDQPIAGKWDIAFANEGAGVFRPTNGVLYLKNTLNTGFADYFAVMGNPGDIGVAGDWDGDGTDSPGIYRPSQAQFYLTNNQQPAGIIFSDLDLYLGNSGDVPVMGDWTGIGRTGAGVFRPTNGQIYMKNDLVTGYGDNALIFGNPGDIPLAGRWSSPSLPFQEMSPLKYLIVQPIDKVFSGINAGSVGAD